MITGFNTDVRFGEKLFHVQTEDKGEKNPFIISLIYQKGLILDSYRTPYGNLLHSNQYSESLLRRILECQHRQLLQAIKSGNFQKGMRLDPFCEEGYIFEYPIPPETASVNGKKAELEASASVNEKMQRISAALIPSTPLTKIGEKENLVPASSEASGNSLEFSINPSKAPAPPMDFPTPQIGLPPGSENELMPPIVAFGETPSLGKSTEPNLLAFRSFGSHSPQRSTRAAPAMEVNDAIKLKKIQGIEICLESSRDFVAGQPVEICLFVQARQYEIRLENVPVMIKVIGTNLAPRLYSGKTDKYGNLKISFTLPEYKIGSAALILQASTPAGGDQVKYLIKKK